MSGLDASAVAALLVEMGQRLTLAGENPYKARSTAALDLFFIAPELHEGRRAFPCPITLAPRAMATSRRRVGLLSAVFGVETVVKRKCASDGVIHRLRLAGDTHRFGRHPRSHRDRFARRSLPSSCTQAGSSAHAPERPRRRRAQRRELMTPLPLGRDS
jgi:hypothetical protein